ncbi:MAG: hypothetical protein CMK09_09955 [Ponticaulis sp.]|nr:hypothetical protein [Ponticaulis sp.]|tara:strand:- start:13075 stop:13368 length:294 start_codon:yes stop_codon:yes gene_type:complete
MKKLLGFALPLALLASPAIAETRTVEIKVPTGPVSAEQFSEIRDSVLSAAKEVCAREQFASSETLTRRALETQCVEDTFAATISEGQARNLPAFTNF